MADGTTYEEAVKNAQQIIFEWIETAESLGREIPQPKGRLAYAWITCTHNIQQTTYNWPQTGRSPQQHTRVSGLHTTNNIQPTRSANYLDESNWYTETPILGEH